MGAKVRWKQQRKVFKYWFKSRSIGLSPDLYWRLHEWYCGQKECELAILPYVKGGGTTAIDIGANFGAYTWHLAKHYDHCQAFEPVSRLAQVLRRGFHISGSNVVIHEVALSDRAGRVQLRIPPMNLGYSTIEPENLLEGKVAPWAEIDSVEVECQPLDHYRFENVGFIKVDVEGHELEVLHGAQETIGRCRPIILLEAEERHRAGSVEGVFDYLKAFDYCRMVVDGLELKEFNKAAGGLESQYRNFVFLQPEVVDEVRDRVLAGSEAALRA